MAVSTVAEEEKAELSSFLGAYVSEASARLGPADGGSLEPVAPQAMRGALLPFVLGLSVIAAPAVLALVFLRGFAFGFTLAFLFEELSYKGILFALASVAPHALFSLPASWLAAGAALTFALGAFKVLTRRRAEETVYAHFLSAAVLTGVAGLLFVVAAWVQSRIAPVLVELAARALSL